MPRHHAPAAQVQFSLRIAIWRREEGAWCSTPVRKNGDARERCTCDIQRQRASGKLQTYSMYRRREKGTRELSAVCTAAASYSLCGFR